MPTERLWGLFLILGLAGGGWAAEPSEVRTLFPLDAPVEISGLELESCRVRWVQPERVKRDQALQVDCLETGHPGLVFSAPEGGWDWSDVGGLVVEIGNPTKSKVAGDLRVATETGQHTAGFTVHPGKSGHYFLPFLPAERKFRGMDVPPNYGGSTMLARPRPAIDRRRVSSLAFHVTQTGQAQALWLRNVRLVPEVALARRIVDRFGQAAEPDWPGKIHAETDFSAGAESLEAVPADWDEFGGWRSGPQRAATGFFRVEKVDGKWWLVTPRGTLFFSLGINAINAGDFTIVTGREDMFTSLPDAAQFPAHFKVVEGGKGSESATEQITQVNFHSANLQRKYGPQYGELWQTHALERLRSWGFNTIGNWSDPGLAARQRVPYVQTVQLWGDFRTYLREGGSKSIPDPFDARFASAALEKISAAAASCGKDPWCLGYFVNNELDWGDWEVPAKRYGIVLKVLEAPADAAAKRAFVATLREKYPEISVLNRRWQRDYASWEEMAASAAEAPSKFTPELEEDLRLLSRAFAERYFSVIRDTISRADGQHLYLGSRFAAKTPEAVEAAARFCDVVSFNSYRARLDPADGVWTFMAKLDRPAMIGEFHFGATDRGMFGAGLSAAATQGGRGRMYQTYVKSVAALPWMVGCHWFQWVDQPLTGRALDGENHNVGLISVGDVPYPELTSAASALHREIYRLRTAP